MKKRLFLSGTVGTGISANRIVNILNRHNHILMGQERYFHLLHKNEIESSHFLKKRFLDIRAGDTHERGGFDIPLPKIGHQFDRAVYVGDKYIPISQNLKHVLKEFPQATFIYMLRNPFSVAESCETRARDPEDVFNLDWRTELRKWNGSVQEVANLKDEYLKRFLFVHYEEIIQDPKRINALFTRLGLSNLEEEKIRPLMEKMEGKEPHLVLRREDLRMHVSMNSDWSSYKNLSNLVKC